LRTSLSICKSPKFWNIEKKKKQLFPHNYFPPNLGLEMLFKIGVEQKMAIYFPFYHEPNCGPSKVIYNNIQVRFCKKKPYVLEECKVMGGFV
jgi:hypothetical protein